MTPTQLRRDLYRLLDEVLETGRALEVTRHGRRLRITPDAPPASVLDQVAGNPGALVGDPDDIVELDWSQHWTGAVDPS